MNFEKLYVNGQWIDGDSGQYIEIENPSDNAIIAKVPRGNKDDVDKGVAAAKEAFKTWQFATLDTRIELMKKVVQGLKENRAYIIDIITKELGSPYKVSRDVHVDPFILEAENYIKIAQNFVYEKRLDDAIVRREPVGVVGGLTPWNFPLEQIVKKVVPALLAGNCVVLKPSQMTPLTSYILTDMIDKAGYPAGVYNLVTGRGGEVGNLLAKNKDVDMISFTGSTEAGKEVAKLALETIKKVALELGGKSATIVLKGGDYELAIKNTLDTVYLNSGQTCNALTRLLVPRDEKEAIEAIIIKQTNDYKFGDVNDKDVDIATLSSQKQLDKVRKYVEIGLKENAKMLLGEVPQKQDKGYYVKPVVFTDVTRDMVIAQEEIFGPVLVVMPYDTAEDAVKIANDSIYGLAGAVFGPAEEANKIARKIRTGTIYVNNGEWDVNAPFGGYKQSGLGREGGLEGYEEFLEIKSIYVK